jgi:hypothetical protein
MTAIYRARLRMRYFTSASAVSACCDETVVTPRGLRTESVTVRCVPIATSPAFAV